MLRLASGPDGIRATLTDSLARAVRDDSSFAVLEVRPPRDAAISDSLAAAFATRDSARYKVLTRDALLRDSVLALNALKPPRLRTTAARHDYAIVVAQRDSIVKGTFAADTAAYRARDRDLAQRDSIFPLLLARDAATRDSLARVRRWQLHGLADAVQMWATGVRGIAQSRVAYVAKGEIHVIDFDGTADIALTKGGRAMSPAWRHDGREIAFSEFSDAGTQIAFVDVETGHKHLLTVTPRGFNITPVYSPDDKLLVFSASNDLHVGLVAVATDGASPLRWIKRSNLYDYSLPAFSPDGSRVAYVSARPKMPQIFSCTLDGTDERLETAAESRGRVYRTSPDWSPDGRTIAFEQQNGRFQIWTLDRATGKLRRLTVTGENEDPSWAPDSRHVAFTSNRGGGKQIWILDTITGRLRQLTSASDGRLAAWSPRLASP